MFFVRGREIFREPLFQSNRQRDNGVSAALAIVDGDAAWPESRSQRAAFSAGGGQVREGEIFKLLSSRFWRLKFFPAALS